MNSQLYLQTEFIYNRTEIKDIFFTAPYKIMRPFRRENGLDITIMMASAGILGGDTLNAEYIFKTNSDVYITTQGYEKIFNTENNIAKKYTKIVCEENSKIYYFPYPVTPFANSDFRNITDVELDHSSTFLYSDICSCGRTGMNEFFQMKRFENRLNVRLNGSLIFADYTLICPSILSYNTIGQWQNFTHNGLLYAYFENEDKQILFLENARKLSKSMLKNGIIGASLAKKGVCVRVLAMSGDDIFSFFRLLAKKHMNF